MGKNGRSVAANQRRPDAEPPDHFGVIAPSCRHRRHDARRWRRSGRTGRAPGRLRARHVVSVSSAQTRQRQRFQSPWPARGCRAIRWICGSGAMPAVRECANGLVDAGRVDVCVADFLFAFANVPLDRGVPTVLFEHNVEYLIWKRLCDLETAAWRRALLEVEWRKLRAREAAACRACDVTIAVSEDDRDRLLALAPAAQITWIPTGVDTNYFTTTAGGERPAHVVFSGSMDWHPNEDAVRYFINDILPLRPRRSSRRDLQRGWAKPVAGAWCGGGGRRCRGDGNPRRHPAVNRRSRALRGAAAGRQRHAPEDFRSARHGQGRGVHHGWRRRARHRIGPALRGRRWRAEFCPRSDRVAQRSGSPPRHWRRRPATGRAPVFLGASRPSF